MQSSQLEQKLDSLISVINGKLEKNEINSVLSSNIVDIYRHKVNLLNDRIDSLTNQIRKSAEVNLTSAHEVQSYKIIIDRQEMMNFQLQISNETMSVENHNLLVATQALTKSASEFQNKIEKSEGKIITFQQKINGKEIEIKSK